MVESAKPLAGRLGAASELNENSTRDFLVSITKVVRIQACPGQEACCSEPLPPAPRCARAYWSRDGWGIDASDARDAARLGRRVLPRAERIRPPDPLDHAAETCGAVLNSRDPPAGGGGAHLDLKRKSTYWPRQK